jgi:hypothetical protein
MRNPLARLPPMATDVEDKPVRPSGPRDSAQWKPHGVPCRSVAWEDTHKRADHGPLRTGSAVLQVLGYRWPEEQDAERELAAKQLERVQPCEALDGLADEDGIIWISSFRDTSNGVRLSIRPFMAEDIPGGRRGVGILRSKPNIHWRKDRGRETRKEADRFTWFWSNGKFTGDRVNDLHLSSERKRSAKCPAGAP